MSNLKNIIIIAGIAIVVLVPGCTSPSESFKLKPYPCVIGCGDKRITPPEGYCYYGGKLMPLSEFYKKYH